MNDQILEVLEKIDISYWQLQHPWNRFVCIIDTKEISISNPNGLVQVGIVLLSKTLDGVDKCNFEITDKKGLALFQKIVDYHNFMAEVHMKEYQIKEQKLKEKSLSELQTVLNIK